MADEDYSIFEVEVDETWPYAVKPKYPDGLNRRAAISGIGEDTPAAPFEANREQDLRNLRSPLQRAEKEVQEYIERVNKCLHKQEADPHGKNPHEPGAKLDQGKVQAGVLLDFSRALWKVAEVGTHGNGKYARGSWLHVPEAKERYEDALMRHLLKIKVEPTDESGLTHLAHFVWNALAVLELGLREEEDQA